MLACDLLAFTKAAKPLLGYPGPTSAAVRLVSNMCKSEAGDHAEEARHAFMSGNVPKFIVSAVWLAVPFFFSCIFHFVSPVLCLLLVCFVYNVNPLHLHLDVSLTFSHNLNQTSTKPYHYSQVNVLKSNLANDASDKESAKLALSGCRAICNLASGFFPSDREKVLMIRIIRTSLILPLYLHHVIP